MFLSKRCRGSSRITMALKQIGDEERQSAGIVQLCEEKAGVRAYYQNIPYGTS